MAGIPPSKKDDDGAAAAAEASTSQRFDYDLFVSYATDPDYRLVRRLENFLESFHRLSVSEQTLRELRICVDGSDFTLPRVRGADRQLEVKGILHDHLRRSRRLLVVCSKNARDSPWVDEELQWFLENRGTAEVLLAVSEGEDPSAKPEEVFSKRTTDAQLHRTVWYDFRGYRGRASRNWAKVRDYEEAFTLLAAHLNDTAPGAILPAWRSEQQRARSRQRRARIAIGIVVATLLAVAGFYALRSIERSQQIQATNEALSYYNQGHTLYMQNPPNSEGAIQAYTKCIEIDSNLYLAYYDRGVTYAVHLNKYDEAIRDLKKAIELRPQFEGSYYFLGFAYHKRNNLDLAIAYYKKALKLDPVDFKASSNLARACDALADAEREAVCKLEQ